MHNDDRDLMSDFVWSFGVLTFGFFIGLLVGHDMTPKFDDGAIAAARGTHVAELVEQADGTSEWVVREVEE